MNFESIIQMAKGAKKPENPGKPEKTEKTQAELRQILMDKMNSLRLSTLDQIEVYEARLEKGEFDDQDGEPEGSGEKRKIQMQKDLLNADQRIDKIKEVLDSGEELPQEPVLDLDVIKTDSQAFLEEAFGKPEKGFSPILIKPEDEDYTARQADVDADKFGEFTVNPDTQNMDFENIPESKIFIPDLSALNGKPLSEVAKYLVDNYAGKYKIPGLEYWNWLKENPAKSPKKIQDGKYYFEFGSLVRDSVGRWDVPCAGWGGSDWGRDASWLSSGWNVRCRVVLLEI
jgi:hypothetical protein